MNEIYQETVSKVGLPRRAGGYFWAVWKMFSLKQFFLTATVLFLVGGLGFFSLDRLKKKAQDIVTHNLPSLSFAGAANANLGQAFTRTLLIMTTEDAEEAATYRKQVDAFSNTTTTALKEYEKAITSAVDRRNFDTLLSRREHYLLVRHDVFAFIDRGQKQAAVRLCKNELLPAYNDYKAAGDVLLEYTMREGKMRGETIMTVCTITQFVVAGFVIVIFIIGFMIGLFR